MSNSLTKYATAGEQEIALKLIRALLRSCYHLSVNDGSDWQQGRSDRQAALGIKPVDWAALRAQQEGGE
jgi:hypothetical protein